MSRCLDLVTCSLSVTDNASHSNKLLKLSDLAGVPVRVAPHQTLNSSKGVIKCPDLRHSTKDEIIDLNDQASQTASI